MSDARGLGTLTAVASVAACSLHRPTFAPAARQQESPMVKVLLNRHRTKGEPNWRWVWIAVAKLGGLMGRRGWQTLRRLIAGYELRPG